MDKEIRTLNDTLVNLFNLVLKLEEEAVSKSAFPDLSLTEVHTMAAIGTGRARTMTHVANLLDVKVSTLTTAVNKLVKKGYVERLRDAHDRRMVKIHLTENGIRAVKIHEAFHREMVESAISEMDKEEVPNFISTIDNLYRFLLANSSMRRIRTTPFALRPLDLGAQQLPVPIVQAGMSIGVAGKRLASAVAIEGGLGLIGTSEIGYRRDDYRENHLEANLKAIEEEVREARRLTAEAGGSGLIGVSIMWNKPYAGRYVEAAVRGGAQVIVTSAGLPKDLPGYCSDRKIALVPTISSRRAASAVIKAWTQKYNRVPDGFIFQGPFAAGLLGFKEEQLERAQHEQDQLIAEIRAELNKLEHCPLIVGGGIYDRTDAERVYQCGADGYLMGTRFVTTEECDAPEAYKKLYLNCSANDVIIIRSPLKTAARVMKNDFVEQVEAEGSTDYDMIEAVRRGAEGDLDHGLIFCGIHAERLKRMETVKDVFREFKQEEQ